MKAKLNIMFAAVVACALCVCTKAQASGAPTSFNITNVIQNGTASITSWPTNVFSTNGTPQSTGNAVPIFNQEHIGISLQGFLYNTNVANTTVVAIQLLTSQAGNTPAVVVGTNYASGLVLGQSNTVTANDWNTPGSGAGSVWMSFVIPTGTNWFNVQTNFQMNGSIFQDANFVGVYQITNNFTNTCFLTNCQLLVNKKLIPSPLIGQ